MNIIERTTGLPLRRNLNLLQVGVGSLLMACGAAIVLIDVAALR